MGKIKVIIEVSEPGDSAFARYNEAIEAADESLRQSESLGRRLAGYGLEFTGDAPVPMFTSSHDADPPGALSTFASPVENADIRAAGYVLSVEIEESKLADLQSRPDTQVWPNSTITFFEAPMERVPVDCGPSAVPLELVQQRLGVPHVWQRGFRGQGVIVGVVDNGVNGRVYPVVGGFSGIAGQLPGGAGAQSHGSMCAADVLVAAPAATFHDYSFLMMPNSFGLARVLQVILNQRRLSGTPHIITNSYGFVDRPNRSLFPTHEVWNIQHPVHRKVMEVVVSGAPAFYAAGNCGAECPFIDCQRSAIGPGASIHAFNSLPHVITVGAVNIQHQRFGFSAQGPGGFEPQKPDIAAYSNFFGNFGLGRPGGMSPPFDGGTSAAAPLAAGVGALLLNAFPRLNPAQIKRALIESAVSLGPPGWNPDTGFGVVSAAAALASIRG